MKHETLNRCWVDVGPPSTTLIQHQPSIGSTSRVCWGSTGPAVKDRNLIYQTGSRWRGGGGDRPREGSTNLIMCSLRSTPLDTPPDKLIIPMEHETSAFCWYNARPTLYTLTQQRARIATCHVYHDSRPPFRRTALNNFPYAISRPNSIVVAISAAPRAARVEGPIEPTPIGPTWSKVSFSPWNGICRGS